MIEGVTLPSTPIYWDLEPTAVNDTFFTVGSTVSIKTQKPLVSGTDVDPEGFPARSVISDLDLYSYKPVESQCP